MWTETFGENGGSPFQYQDDKLVLTHISGAVYNFDAQDCIRNLTLTFTDEVTNKKYTFPSKGNG